jgi:predicted Zn-dependent peptidase
MSREAIAAYHSAHYRPSSIVVAAAGRLDHDAVVERVQGGRLDGAGVRPSRVVSAPRPPRRLYVMERPTEQAHLVWGVPGLRRDDRDRHAMAVLNHVLGGGMASRLFQEIREKRGLAYSVYSYRSGYQETGMLAVYAGTAPNQAHRVLDLLDTEVDRLVREGTITGRELDNAKGAMKGGLALGLESSSSRMTRLGRSELTLGEVPTIDEMVADIERVTLDDVARVVDRVLRTTAPVLAVVGPFAERDFAARVA